MSEDQQSNTEPSAAIPDPESQPQTPEASTEINPAQAAGPQQIQATRNPKSPAIEAGPIILNESDQSSGGGKKE